MLLIPNILRIHSSQTMLAPWHSMACTQLLCSDLTCIAGVAATVVNDAVMTPADVVKQRLQVSRGQNVSMLKCIVRVWQEGGIAAFYRCAGCISCGIDKPEQACLKPEMSGIVWHYLCRLRV